MINTNPNHIHTYDAQGRMTCCSEEEKIYTKANANNLLNEQKEPNKERKQAFSGISVKNKAWKKYLPAIISLVMLLAGMVFDFYVKPDFFKDYIRLSWYIVAYLPAGLPVMKEDIHSILKGAFFFRIFFNEYRCYWRICLSNNIRKVLR